MSWSADSGSITADSGYFTADGGTLPAVIIVGTMPILTGLELYGAIYALQLAGIYVPASLGYFGVFPITVIWQRSAIFPSTVLSQSISPGTIVPPNSPVTLVVSEFAIAVAFP